MASKVIKVLLVTTLITYCNGGFEATNYDISRKKHRLDLQDIAQFFLGGNRYGEPYPDHHYPDHYPGYGNYPNHHQGNYPGNHHQGGYPGHYPPPGPPGAHPNCPLCDSSVYSYCSYKQTHDSCCCESFSLVNLITCRGNECRNLYANSCQEYRLISDCCCVDLQKSALPAAAGAIPVPVVAPIIAVGRGH